MYDGLRSASLRALHVTVGVVVLVQALFLAWHPRAIQAFAQTGLPDFIRLALAWSEILSAVLFLWPRTLSWGAPALLAVLAGALALHVALLQNPGGLLVYMAAVVVVWCHYRRADRAQQRAAST